MRTLSKGNCRVVHDPAKGGSMSMVAVYRKNLDGTLSLIDKETGNGTNEGSLKEKAVKIINELNKKED